MPTVALRGLAVHSVPPSLRLLAATSPRARWAEHSALGGPVRALGGGCAQRSWAGNLGEWNPAAPGAWRSVPLSPFPGCRLPSRSSWIVILNPFTATRPKRNHPHRRRTPCVFPASFLVRSWRWAAGREQTAGSDPDTPRDRAISFSSWEERPPQDPRTSTAP